MGINELECDLCGDDVENACGCGLHLCHAHYEDHECKPQLSKAKAKPNDGGAAFPRPASEGGGKGYGEQDGLSLRDYFAGQAAPALLAYSHRAGVEYSVDGVADDSYRIADALLSAREGK